MVLRHFSIASLIFLILVTVASVIFVYLISPLRDPAFQPNSANAGTLVWWLKDVREDVWVWAAFILAGLLTLNSLLALWTLQRVRQIGLLITLGLLMWYMLYYVFMLYLLGQWLVD